MGSHGVVMMIRLPDFNLLHDSWGRDLAEEQLFALINLLSTFIMRYPGSLLARYPPQRLCRPVAAPHIERSGEHRRAVIKSSRCITG
ncbi:regulatory protein CsrD [Citrobacter koseri]|uniref:Regulatory protein CsrD n=1 Tax=Citrobacter koseri TaxID=545 RepID=A0A2X2YFC2_CITKO|nr:regulatory protein CsrD [Citrobacter koseri]